MKALVVGQGGREHALVRALHQSHSVNEVHVTPGNDGMRTMAHCHAVQANDLPVLTNLAKDLKVDLVIIGPEDPLVAGAADVLREAGVLTFGPSGAAAQLEGSKVFAKEFMRRAGVPTAKYVVVSSVEQAMDEAQNFTPPYVLKADGLAAGKGVAICRDLQELKTQSERYFDKKVFGVAGERALLEQFQPGWELSYHILTNGSDFVPLPLAQDHKRIGTGDTGANTGGMGTVAPLKIDSQLNERIVTEILQPSVDQLKKEKLLFRGVLFVGLMVTEDGPTVIEYNVRFGDPETQVMMPLLDGDWGQVFAKVAAGEMPTVQWKDSRAACVVLAAENYPGSPVKGVEISGDINKDTGESYFIHSGTKEENGKWWVNGGRVLSAVALAEDLEAAITNAYNQVSSVEWPGMQVRSDIGQKVLKK